MNRKEVFKYFLTLVIGVLLLTSSLSAWIGSNLGNYGTHFSPATLTGKVTDGSGNPVANASVSTIAGQFTKTDSNGNYTLYLDAPGIYTVTATDGSKSDTKQTEVSLGTTTTLNFQLSATVQQYTVSVSKSGSGTGTVTSNPAGIDCGATCSAQFASGTTVTLTATADTGSSFSTWGGDCSTCGNNNTCNLTVNSDKNCTATFDSSSHSTATSTPPPTTPPPPQPPSEPEFPSRKLPDGSIVKVEDGVFTSITVLNAPPYECNIPQDIEAITPWLRFVAKVDEGKDGVWISLELNQPPPEGMKVGKCTKEGFKLIENVEVKGSEVKFFIEDGGEFDYDGKRDGYVRDPFAIVLDREENGVGAGGEDKVGEDSTPKAQSSGGSGCNTGGASLLIVLLFVSASLVRKRI